jgi:hypothetical protein
MPRPTLISGKERPKYQYNRKEDGNGTAECKLIGNVRWQEWGICDSKENPKRPAGDGACEAGKGSVGLMLAILE